MTDSSRGAADAKLPLVVAITGATGVIYGVEMLRVLRALGHETHLTLSEAAGLNLSIETDYAIDEVRSLADVVYSNKDVGAAVASGSFRTRGMIVAPCTVKTLSAVANSFTSRSARHSTRWESSTRCSPAGAGAAATRRRSLRWRSHDEMRAMGRPMRECARRIVVRP
ncbi:MAG: hypothetical protein KJZ83_17825 [Burkholderiaceae bacterium]|nr:hypothetical protein [Burkholderiaceae bacterium]